MDPSATIESSTGLLSQGIVDEDTSSVTYAAPRDSVEQGTLILPEEDTAKPVASVAIFPVASVAIFPERTNFFAKIRTGLLETDDDNALSLGLNADTVFSDRVYLKQGKDPDKAGCSTRTHQGQGGAGERKVLLDRAQRKTLQ